MHRTGWLAISSSLLLAGVAWAGQPTGDRPAYWNVRALWERRRQCWCPDDYCPKCLPCPPVRIDSCLPDDYCPKCPPAPPFRAPCGWCDDYRPRCSPVHIRACEGVCGRVSSEN